MQNRRKPLDPSLESVVDVVLQLCVLAAEWIHAPSTACRGSDLTVSDVIVLHKREEFGEVNAIRGAVAIDLSPQQLEMFLRHVVACEEKPRAPARTVIYGP